MADELAQRSADAARKASERLGTQLGLERARSERWKARALDAERELRTTRARCDRALRQLIARIDQLERRRP